MANLPANPGQALWIGSDSGKYHCNIGIGGPGGDLDHTDYSQAQIESGFSLPDYFFLDANGDVVFKQYVENGRTSTNTKYARTELRELQPNGTTKAAWDSGSGTFSDEAISKIDHVPSAKPWVVFFQVHDPDSDFFRVQTEDGAIVCRRTPPGGSEIRTVLRSSYTIGAWISWKWQFDSGRLRIWLDGTVVLDVTGMSKTGCYAKFGCYNQVNNRSDGGNAPTGEYCQVTVQRGSVKRVRPGYPASSTPVFTGGTDPGGGPGGGAGDDTQAPTTPTDLTVTHTDAGNQLSWGASTDNVGVDHYNVYRSSGTSTGGTGGTVDLSTAAGRLGWGTPLPSSDEFDYTGAPDPAKWNVYDGTGHDGNGVRSPQRVTVANGKMILTGLDGSANTAGMEHRLNQQYGRWEVRVKSYYTNDPTAPGDKSGGYHPVLIVWSDDASWPAAGEYDFCENGEPGEQQADGFMHYPSLDGSDHQEELPRIAVDLREWHNFAFEWTSDGLTGWIDGVQWFTLSGGAVAGQQAAIQAMPSGHLTVQLDALQATSCIASTMEVDWARVYSLTGGGGTDIGGGATSSTFGRQTVGSATTTSSADKLVASKFTAADAGTLTAGHARMWLDSAGTTHARQLIYADSGGSPGALLATSDEATLTSTASGNVVDFTFSGAAQISIAAGTSYWIAVSWDDPGTPNLVYSRDTQTGLRRERSDVTYGTFPNPFGTATGTFAGPIDTWAVTGTTGGGGGGTITTTSSFGKQTDGASSSASTADKTAVSKFTATSTGTLSAGHARAWMSAGSTTCKAVVYADSGGNPGALLAQADAKTISNTGEQVIDFVFSGAERITITSGTAYWLGLSWQDPGSASLNISRDGTTSGRQESSSYLPNPFGTPTALSGPVDVYVDVTSTATGGGGSTTTQPTVRSSSTAAKSAGSDTSISATKPAGLAVGDYLWAVSVADADGALASMTAAGFATLSSQAGDPTNNYPFVKTFGKVADSSDVAASSFSFGFPAGPDGVTVLTAITAGTYDPTTPITVGPFTTTPRTSTVSQTAPSMTGVASGLLFDIFGTDTNNTVESYPTSGPAGFTRLATVQGATHYAMCGVYYKALTAAGATGTASVSPTGAGTTNGWTTHTLMVNPKVAAGGGGGQVGQTLIAQVSGTSYLDTDAATSGGGGSTGGQSLGVGGIPTPAAGPNVVLASSDSSSRLNISTSGTSTTPRIYDGRGHSTAGVTVNASNVIVQNFVIHGSGHDAVSIFGDNVTIQNCDIYGVHDDGTGDINAITLFGDGIRILFNTCGVTDFLVSGDPGGSHTDFCQTWNTSSKQSTSNLIIQGNRIVGPGTGDNRFIHQGVQGEGKDSTDGGGGGSGVSSGWLIADNSFEMSCVNQVLNFLDIHDVKITRNTFSGSASHVVGTGDGSDGIVFYDDNDTSAFSGTVPSTIPGPGPAGVVTGGGSAGGGAEAPAYTYAVSAIDAAGNESGQAVVGGGSGGPDTEAPTVPPNLTAAIDDGRIGLTWGPATDNVGVVKYTVRRDGAVLAFVTTTGYVDIDVTNGVAYSYTVSASDAAGNESAQTAPVSATPAVVPPGGVPLLPGRLSGGKVEVAIAWGADLTADENTWIWSDITADVRQDPGISCALGRNDESETSNPANLTLVLDNTQADYSLGTVSAHYPNVRRSTPVRVRIDPGDNVGARAVFLGFADGFTPGWDAMNGRIPVVTLSASGTLRRLGQGKAPIQSAYRRVMTASPTVVAYWPFEEGNSSRLAPCVKGGDDMTLVGRPDWASVDEFDCSASLPSLRDGHFTAAVNSYTDTGQGQLRFLLSVPDNGLDDDTTLVRITTTGTLSRWDIVYRIFADASAGLQLRKYSGSTLFSEDAIALDPRGKPARIGLDWTQAGSNLAWNLSLTPPGVTALFGGLTISGKTFGVITQVEVNPLGAKVDAGFGHLTIENAVTDLFSDFQALTAYVGENTVSVERGRLGRLCGENQVPLQLYGVPGTLTTLDNMGPQLVAPLLDLLHECETADQGQLWDGRNAGLSYTTRRRRGVGTVKLTVDALAGQLAGEFTPIDDDQRNRNRMTVTRLHGVTVTYEDTTGPLGTAAIGIYDDSITVNTADDTSAIRFARWFVELGTVEGYRYPSVTVDLAASPELAPAVLDIIPGERIDVTNLDTTLAGFPDATVSLIVEGIAHEITPRSWKATFRCSPYTPWATGLEGV